MFPTKTYRRRKSRPSDYHRSAEASDLDAEHDTVSCFLNIRLTFMVFKSSWKETTHYRNHRIPPNNGYDEGRKSGSTRVGSLSLFINYTHKW